MEEVLTERLLELPIKEIEPNPHQPRRFFCEEELSDLAHSIASVGIIHPPSVWRCPTSGQYYLVSGERRWRAAQLAGLSTITVVLLPAGGRYSAQAALIENVQRVDLNPIEVAMALQSLIERYGYTQEQLAAIIGKKRSTVANYLRLLTLSAPIRASVAGGAITMGHAKALLSLTDEEARLRLLQKITKDDLSVRQAELLATPAGTAPRKRVREQTGDLFLNHLSQQLQQKLGTRVVINGDGKGGKISIEYFSLDDLDRLLSLIGA